MTELMMTGNGVGQALPTTDPTTRDADVGMIMKTIMRKTIAGKEGAAEVLS